MKKIFSRKWLTVFVSLVLLTAGYKIVKACADGGWYIEDSTNIAPEAFVQDSTYTPFFYSEMFYYGINYDENNIQRFNKTNLLEWDKYMDHKVDTATIAAILYKTPIQIIGHINAAYLNKSLILDEPYLTRFRQLQKGGDKAKKFMTYMIFASQAETYASNEIQYYWEYQKKQTPDASKLDGLERKLSDAFDAEKDSFMKERYWFQLIRYYYFYNPEKAIELFEKTKTQFSPDNMYYRTVGYVAGAYYKQKQYAPSNYYYSLVFSGNKQMRTVAHWSFHPQEESDWNQTLAMAKTPEEKTTLWQMLGIFYKDELRSMQEIYKLKPSSPDLDVLLTRYLNAFETSGIFYYYQEMDLSKNYKDSLIRTKRPEVEWIQHVTKEGKVSNPFLWNVSSGYLAFLNNNYAEASEYYKMAEKEITRDNKLASEQLRLLKLINSVGSLTKVTPTDENRLLPDLDWLFFDKNKTGLLRTANAISWIRGEMSKKYAKQKEMQKSECFSSSQAFYANDRNISQYRTFLEKKSFTPYETFCKKISAIKLKDVYTYLAVKETLNDADLKQAYNLFVMSEDSVVLLANPFNGKIKDCHDCDFEAPQKVKYTKGQLVKKLIEMKANIQTGQDVYNNALLVANAFYNMNFYGNARCFYEGAIIGYGMSYPEAIDFHFRQWLTDNKIAVKYYSLALQHANNNEQRAKCYFMLAKCERNQWYNKTYYSFEDNQYRYKEYNGPDFIEWNSFKELKKLSQTAFYRDAIRECGYFRKTAQ